MRSYNAHIFHKIFLNPKLRFYIKEANAGPRDAVVKRAAPANLTTGNSKHGGGVLPGGLW